jgi:hypothetical protein
VTEAEWLACADPDEMLDFILDRTSERKYRLFACACVRRHANLLQDYMWCEKALQAAEALCDGRLSQARFKRAASNFDAAVEEEDLDDPADTVSTALWHVMNACKTIEGSAWAKSKAAAGCMASVAAARKRNAGVRAERELQAYLIRCLVNPFHPVTLTPSTTVADLAQVAYLERLPGGELDPARLAVLADALEEAGCDSAELLGHLRGQGPHVRGCWAVDLILGKE